MKILILNGPNLNMLGQRDAAHYGAKTLAEIEALVLDRAKELGVEVEFFQSNHEGAIVDRVQERASNCSGIIVNPGALTTYGQSLGDALVDAGLPVMEVHLSNIHGREEFRRHSVIAPLAVGQISGLRWRGYVYALEFLAAYLKSEPD